MPMRRVGMSANIVHDDFAYGKEFLGGERLGEEVRDIFVRFNERDNNFVVLDYSSRIQNTFLSQCFMRLWCA